MSRQAFAQSREKIIPESLCHLNDLVVGKFEAEDGDIETYRGYRLLAVDGSYIDLPNNSVVREHFGYSSNGSDVTSAKGLAMTLFDVLNKITIFSELYRYNDSEKKRVFDIADDMQKTYAYRNSILLLDRGYPSFDLFHHLADNKQHYIARVQSSFLKEISTSTGEDNQISILRKHSSINVRVVNIILDSGETEQLVTNLPSDFSVSDLKELYAKRWEIETNFNYLKNKSLIECFTGETVTAILQDFYIGVLMLNVAAIAYREQEDILTASEPAKKYQLKPSFSQLIADIKVNWLNILLCKNPLQSAWLKILFYKRIKRFAFYYVPNRHFKRSISRGHLIRTTHPKPSF